MHFNKQSFKIAEILDIAREHFENEHFLKNTLVQITFW